MPTKKPLEVFRAPSEELWKKYWPSTVRTLPLVYDRGVDTNVNYAQLPGQETTRDMELAFREQPISDKEIRGRTVVHVVAAACLGLLAASFLFGFKEALTALPELGCSIGLLPILLNVVFLILVAAVLARRSFKQALFIVFVGLPVLAVLAPFVAMIVPTIPSIGALFFGAILALAVLIPRFSQEPFRLYRGWLFTEPRLRPETRRAELARAATLSRPDLPFFFGLSALVVLLSFSRSLILSWLLLLVLLGFVAWRLSSSGGLPRLLRSAFAILERYLNYGHLAVYPPGVWPPESQRGVRLLRFYALVAVAHLFLTPSLVAAFFYRVSLIDETKPLAGLVALGTTSGITRGLGWANFLVPLVALVLPTLVLLVLFRRLLVQADELRAHVDTLDHDERSEWQWYVDRVRGSVHVARDPLREPVYEAGHLFLGVEPRFRTPAYLDERLLDAHCYIVGETGSGKTTLGIMPLLLQLLRGRKVSAEELSTLDADEVQHIRDNDGTTLPPAVVILDLKGETALLHQVRSEALDSLHQPFQQPFRLFAPSPDAVSHYFNPFASFESEARSLISFCNLFLDSLSLNHGEGYGRSYYTRQNRHLLFEVMAKTKPAPTNFEELYSALRARWSKSGEFRDAFELVSTVHALTQYRKLLTTDDQEVHNPGNCIHMRRVLEERQVAYFWLPAVLESIAVREIAKLALFSLVTAAIERQREGKPRRDVYLVIDEFQRVVGENFRILLEQARSFGVHLILANQSIADLNTPEYDLRPAVRTNTRTKLYFSLSDPLDAAILSEGSGQELAWMTRWGTSQTGMSTTRMWQADSTLKPRLTTNDIFSTGDHPLDFLLHVSRGAGYTQYAGLPIRVRTRWPFPKEHFDAMDSKPWPTAEDLGIEEPPVLDSRPGPQPSDRDIEAERELEASREQAAAIESLAKDPE